MIKLFLICYRLDSIECLQRQKTCFFQVSLSAFRLIELHGREMNRPYDEKLKNDLATLQINRKKSCIWPGSKINMIIREINNKMFAKISKIIGQILSERSAF